MTKINLIQEIFEAMESDDCDMFKQSGRLYVKYEKQLPEVQAVIDDIFVCLCGFSLPTLINTAVERSRHE